ncbi:unnamed protein product [Spirodela intermedia]|uniref:Knottins-like domain-containing protein n=1 Tax=Spirodela intermedia TaxID=51605 RepID=A0A7I8IY35_SPIIN|nr:unnamed protein product [Spirodela intermedia]CAA6662719.1 unnamed protein product [Spirodela intermedia]
MASARVVPTILLLVMLLPLFATTGAAKDVGRTVEPSQIRDCSSLSTRFTGRCSSHTNCSIICRTEGFILGECRGFIRRRCYCIKPCPKQ